MSAGFVGFCVLTVFLFAALVAAALGFDFFICTRLPENLPSPPQKQKARPLARLSLGVFFFLSLCSEYQIAKGTLDIF
jgi:hypothetical protein